MGLSEWWRRTFGSKRPSVVALRSLEAAAMFPVELSGVGRRRMDVTPCKSCGGELEEVLITSGGPEGEPEVWRKRPVAIDGWRCASCSDVVYPRCLEPEETTALGDEGAEATKAGRLDDAELAMRRIVSSWPTYRPGRFDLAQVLEERLLAERRGEARDFVELALLVAIEEQLAKAFEAEGPPPRHVLVWIAVRCALAREQAQRAANIVRDEMARPDAAAEDRAELERAAEYVRLRHDLYAQGTEAIRPFLRVHGEAPKKPTPAEERRILRGAEDLVRHAEANPASWQALWIAAKGLQALDRRADARDLFGRAFALAPNQADVAREYGLELLEAGLFGDAVTVATAACAASPSDAGLVGNLALAHLLAGDLAAASANAERAVTMDPRDPINRNLQKLANACASGARPMPRSLAELEGRRKS